MKRLATKRPTTKGLAFAVAVAVLIVGFVVGAMLFRQQRAEELGFLADERVSTFVRDHAPRKGPPDARVWLVEFTDPACETCATFSRVIDHFMNEHPGKIQLVLRYAPFHEGADVAVRMLEAARRQGKFWETLDVVYRTQRRWTRHHRVMPDRLWAILSQTGLDMERLRADMDDPQITEIIEQDLEDAEALYVRKTPGIFVNGRPLEPFGVERLEELIESEIAASYPE